MGLFEDIEAARVLVTNLRTEVTEAQSRLSAAEKALVDLEALVVKGGPDVSVHQGSIDWAKVAGAGCDLAFHRIADGDLVDATYTPARIAAIKSAGLSYAPYYFARVASDGNGQRDGRVEAAMAIYFAGKQGWGKPGDLPLAYDIETLNGQTSAKARTHVIQFINAYKGMMGHAPILYTTPDFWTNTLAPGSGLLAAAVDCPLWIAHWGVSAPTVPAPWTNWAFWQYTDKATVPGISSPCDNNRVNISREALDALRLR